MLSSQNSGPSSSIHPQTTTGVHPTPTGRTKVVTLPEEQTDFALEAYLTNLNISAYMEMEEEDQEKRLESIDAIELFTALQEISKESANLRLENHVLYDFLEKNDPRLLIGLRQRRATASSIPRRSTGSISGSAVGQTRSMRRSSLRSVTASQYTVSKPKHVDYHLNYRAKADLTDKTASDVLKRIQEIEENANDEIRTLNGRLEEKHYSLNETLETYTNFELHFLRDPRDREFLASATERTIEKKFRKFVNNWAKNANALLATMRLKIIKLQENCQQMRADLITKADLSGILGAVDFEQLKIKREELMQILEDKNMHMTGLKGVTGKASMSMSDEKQTMMNLEDEYKSINAKINDVVQKTTKLGKEILYVEDQNSRDVKIQDKLQNQLDRFEAPSVNSYIEIKDELMMLEKEEKMLQRKLYIMKMKIDNTMKRVPS